MSSAVGDLGVGVFNDIDVDTSRLPLLIFRLGDKNFLPLSYQSELSPQVADVEGEIASFLLVIDLEVEPILVAVSIGIYP